MLKLVLDTTSCEHGRASHNLKFSNIGGHPAPRLLLHLRVTVLPAWMSADCQDASVQLKRCQWHRVVWAGGSDLLCIAHLWASVLVMWRMVGTASYGSRCRTALGCCQRRHTHL